MSHSEPPNCSCGHPWIDHHGGCVMNPAYPCEAHAYGICRGVSAQECEWTQVNGCRIREEEPECTCNNYVNADTGLSGYQAEGIPNESNFDI